MILDAVPAGPGRDVPITLLARLNRERRPGRDGDNRLEFIVLVPRGVNPDEDHQPQEGESLVMIAGSVAKTGGGNDYVLGFDLDFGAKEGDERLLSVTVPRRKFSLREAALRKAYEGDRNEFRGTPMLVKLGRRRDDVTWEGSVIDAPPRPEETIRGWARTDPDRAYVAIGGVRKGYVLAEPRPGVLARLSVGTRIPQRGSICKLRVTDTGHELDLVIPGDLSYVPGTGRSAHLLLKDDALRLRGGPNSSGGFTVAGFPDVEIRDNHAAQRASYQRPPRLGIVRRGAAGGLEIDIQQTVRAGRLLPTPPHVRPFGSGRAPDLDWPKLSFLDDKPEVLRAHTRRGAWHYHDRVTGYWRSREFKDEDLPNPAKSSDGPLFFDDEWRLRYQAQDLRRFGYSAKELLEHGLPKDNDWYPVAGPASRGGLWVELSPGRVVELGAGLLHSPAAVGSALDGFAWSHFAPGDQIKLRGIQEQEAETIAFELADWRPGPRGFFGRTRALLPASADVEKYLVLGQGPFRLTWPGRRRPSGEAVWLTEGNELAAFDGELAVGDVVLLEVDEQDELRVIGAPRLRVDLGSGWGAAEWSRDRLASPQRGALLQMMGGAFPAVVATVAEDGITVGSRAPSEDKARLMAGHLLGVLDPDFAVFRSGSALRRLSLHNLLPGVPPVEREVVGARAGGEGGLAVARECWRRLAIAVLGGERRRHAHRPAPLRRAQRDRLPKRDRPLYRVAPPRRPGLGRNKLRGRRTGSGAGDG